MGARRSAERQEKASKHMQTETGTPAAKSKEIPGPGLEESGAALAKFMAQPLAFFEELVEKYGRINAIAVGPSKNVFLHDALDVEQVLRFDMHSYDMGQLTHALNYPLLGDSMPVTPDHLYWQQLHSIMLPMFTPKMLRLYFERTVEAVRDEVEILGTYAKSGEVFDLEQQIRLGVFDALTRTIFTRGLDRTEIPQILEMFISACTYMNARYISMNPAYEASNDAERAGLEALERLNKRVYELIAYRKQNPVDEQEDMLDVLLAARLSDGRPLSDKELRDNVMALLFGGQETTPTEITWAFALLATHPEEREKLIEEVDRVLGDRTPTFDDLEQLEFCRMVFDETTRLYPAFSYIGREAKADTQVGDYAIKKGTSIGFVAWTIHRDPRWWPEPEAFVPERHSREEIKTRPRCALVSFGYGRRRCLGERVGRMEGTLMLAMAHQKFVFELRNGQLPKPMVRMAIHPEGGLQVTAVPRPAL
jgi:cytochrome P450